MSPNSQSPWEAVNLKSNKSFFWRWVDSIEVILSVAWHCWWDKWKSEKVTLLLNLYWLTLTKRIPVRERNSVCRTPVCFAKHVFHTTIALRCSLVQIIEPSPCNESRVDFKPLKFLCSRIVGTGRPPSHLNTAFEFFFFENVKVGFF